MTGATDPRAVAMLAEDRRWHNENPWSSGAPSLDHLLAVCDAADRAADPPWIRIRCDEATVRLIAMTSWYRPGGRHETQPWRDVDPDVQRMYEAEARAVLAALAGEQ